MSLLAVFEASLVDLVGLSRTLKEGSALYYAQVLQAFLGGDRAELERLEKRAPLPELGLFCRLRRQARERDVAGLGDLLNEIRSHSFSEPLFRAEAQALLGLGFEVRGEHSQSAEAYLAAAQLFKSEACPKRALRCFQNHVAALSRLEPFKSFFVEYHYVLHEAQRLGDEGAEGIASLNLSREFQKLGALQNALRLADRAVVAFAGLHAGSLHHGLALAHRCHLLLQMGYESQALLDFQAARFAEFVEVEAALSLLNEHFQIAGLRSLEECEAQLLPTWRERLDEVPRPSEKPLGRLAPLEEQVLSLLASGPRSKTELMSELYGERISFLHRENRLKNLLNRLRRKWPGRLAYQEGRYSLSDPLLERELR